MPDTDADTDLAQRVKRLRDEAQGYVDKAFKPNREEALRLYEGRMTPEEEEKRQPGMTRYIAPEVRDAVDDVHANLMRIYTASGRLVRYRPRGREDAAKAKALDKLAAWVLDVQNDGYLVTDDLVMNALKLRYGVLKVSVQAETRERLRLYEGLGEADLSRFEQDAIVKTESHDDGTLNVTVKESEEIAKVRIESIPPEELIWDQDARDLETAAFVAHRCELTVSELLDQGYDADQVHALADKATAGADEAYGYDEESFRTRASDFGGEDEGEDDESQRLIDVTEAYLRVDTKGDGHSELRRVVLAGNDEVLANDPVERIPFAVATPVRIPHALVGYSVTDYFRDQQAVATEVSRQMLNNLYKVNNPRIMASEADLQDGWDSLFDQTPGSPINARPGEVAPFVIPPLIENSLSVLEHLRQKSDRRLGSGQGSGALDPDVLNKQTATAVVAARDAAAIRMEMMARNIAETAFKRLAVLLLDAMAEALDAETIANVLGDEASEFDGAFDQEFDVEVVVGLGTGRDDERMGAIARVAGFQQSVLEAYGPDNPLVSVQQLAHAQRQLLEGAGVRDTDAYIASDQAIAEGLASQQGQDPEAAAAAQEQAKLQAEQQLALQKLQMELESKHQIEMAKIASQERIALAKLQAEREEMSIEAALKAEQVATGQDINPNVTGPVF